MEPLYIDKRGPKLTAVAEPEDSDIYPCFLLIDIPQESRKISDDKRTMELLHDADYRKNKFILHCYELRDPTPYLDAATPDACKEVLGFLLKPVSKYPASINPRRYFHVLRTVMDTLVAGLSVKEKNALVEELSHKPNDGYTDICQCRYDDRYHPEKFEGIDHFTSIAPIIGFLKEYETPDHDHDMCKYCLSSVPMGRLVHPCDCVTPVHVECFLQWHTWDKENCEICGAKFKVNQRRYGYLGLLESGLDDQVFFPFDDFYPVPLMHIPIIKYTGDDRIRYAALYFQTDRLRDLWKDPANREVILESVLRAVESPNQCSNYPRKWNMEAIAEMIVMVGL